MFKTRVNALLNPDGRISSLQPRSASAGRPTTVLAGWICRQVNTITAGCLNGGRAFQMPPYVYSPWQKTIPVSPLVRIRLIFSALMHSVLRLNVLSKIYLIGIKFHPIILHKWVWFKLRWLELNKLICSNRYFSNIQLILNVVHICHASGNRKFGFYKIYL